MLDIQGLSVGYQHRLVLQDIDMEVQAGELVAVIGPNGAGKSSLLKAVSGFLPATAGKVLVDGKQVNRLDAATRARMLSVVPQAHSLPSDFQVFQTVLLGRTPYLGWLGQAGAKDYALVEKAMMQTDTLHLGDRLMGELSGGEQQRVLLARALAQAAPVMLLDEPTNHLDIRHQTEFLTLMRRLAKENGLTVLAALHDLNLTALYADRVAILSRGWLKALGTPEQVFTDEILSDVYGTSLRVVSHPELGLPLVLPGGPSPRGVAIAFGQDIPLKI